MCAKNREEFGSYCIKKADKRNYFLHFQIGQGDLFVDAKNQETSNWLRYVNCCRSLTEQNLLAYQYRGQIYYRTIVDVPPDTELLVWYGDDYGRELGVKQGTSLTTQIPQTSFGPEGAVFGGIFLPAYFYFDFEKHWPVSGLQ